MKKIHITTLLCLLSALALSGSPLTAVAQQNATNSAAPVKFRPKTTNSQSVRVSGGSRGAGTSAVTLDVLAPDDVGLTTQPQPSLFWFQSKPANAKFELTLLQDKKPKPLLQVTVERSAEAGIQRLKLSEHNVKLSPGVEYQWVVALITDPENRSTDQIASGVVKYVEPDAALKTKLASQTAPGNLAAIYADAGIWYDALATLSDQIDADPQNKALREARAELLRQVGLKAAARAGS